jgi:hypothetical protein
MAAPLSLTHASAVKKSALSFIFHASTAGAFSVRFHAISANRKPGLTNVDHERMSKPSALHREMLVRVWSASPPVGPKSLIKFDVCSLTLTKRLSADLAKETALAL